jgi:hypothetical protein
MVLKGLEDLSKAVASSLTSGEEPVQLIEKNFQMSVARDDPSNVAGAALEVASFNGGPAGGFTMPTTFATDIKETSARRMTVVREGREGRRRRRLSQQQEGKTRDEGVRGGMWGGGGPEVKEGKVGGGYGVGNGKESEEEGEEGDDVEREGSASFMGRRRRRLKKGGAVDSKVLNFADNIHGGGTLDSPVQSLTFRAAGSGDTLDVSGLSQAILIRIPMRTVPTTPEESANMSFPKRVICLPNVSHTLTISCGNGTNIYYECLANQTNTNTSTTTSTGTGTGTSAKSTAKNEENASDPSPLTLTCPTVVEQPR